MTPYPQLIRLPFQTGVRKTHASPRVFGATMDINDTLANGGMMRIGENIHAICPPYATVAPILHGLVRDDPAHRGTTLNNGAADADGR
jgi:hypothetical protein